MSLTTKQYNQLIREYDRLQLRNVHDLDKRTEEVYARIPKIRALHNQISSLSVAEAKERLLSGNAAKNTAIGREIEQLSAEKTALLTEHGYPTDYLTMHYTCDACKDTGYIENEMCHCMKSKIIRLLYEQSNLKDLIAKENFDTFCLDYYPSDLVDESTGVSARENMQEILAYLHEYTETFPQDSKNLLFYGAAGVGKTFLINCIAKELMEQSHSVIYMSAIHFFEVLADASFHKSSQLSEYETTVQRDLYDCDLLILDDLGTEVANSFTASALFQCINERSLRKKPVIISTNLPLSSIRTIYSDRVFSRIASNYKIIKIFGKDIRILKSLKH